MTGAAANGGSAVRITGVGAELPPRIVTSAEIEARADIGRFGFAPGWIEKVTGVRERRWAEPGVEPWNLAATAGQRALAAAGLDPSDVDTVVYCGIMKDFFEPATANAVAEAVGAVHARVFDVTNACNGIADGLDIAEAFIRTGRAERVLLATGERASRAIFWDAESADELRRAVAGMALTDGGGALVVERTDDPRRGLMAREHRSNPTQWRHGIAGRTRRETEACEACGGIVDHRFTCDGRALFRSVFELFLPTVHALAERTGWTLDDVDIIFLHEAGRRFVDVAAAGLGEERKALDKLWSTAARLGNTSSMTLPVQMDDALAAGALRPGTKVLAVGGAAGVSCAAMTMVW